MTTRTVSVGNMTGLSSTNSSNDLENLSLPRYVPARQPDILYVSQYPFEQDKDDESSSSEEDPNPIHVPHHWPRLFDDSAARKRNEFPPQLSIHYPDVEQQVKSTKRIYVRIVTWNQQHVQESFAEHSPYEAQVIHLLQKELIPMGVYHIVAIGTQECQTSIAKSFFFPKKEWWENMCRKVLGEHYEMVRGHSLQATHLVLFVHKGIHHLITHVHSHAVATGIMDTLGNKGGIAISMNICGSSFCFLTAHLAAHPKRMDRRTDEFLKISKEMSHVLGHFTSSSPTIHDTTTSWNMSGPRIYPNNGVSITTSTTIEYPQKKSCLPCFAKQVYLEPKPHHNPLIDEFDFVFWAGDFNYRIFGSRDVVDTLLDNNRHDVLWNKDQLFTLMQYDTIFIGLQEGPVHFKPSYKLNVDSDVYDTSRKRRVPAWTDRVLHKATSPVKQISYSSATKVRLSDHRPVYATYQCMLSEDAHDDAISNMTQDDVPWTSETKSQVCVIS